MFQGVEGTGLAFIIFTQAINEFGPSAPFWSVVFFLMLLSLGLGSEFGTIEGVTTSLYDLEIFPWMKKKWLVSGNVNSLNSEVTRLLVYQRNHIHLLNVNISLSEASLELENNVYT